MIALVGDVMVDRVVTPPDKTEVLFRGGMAANYALMIASLGVPSALIATIGSDTAGQFALESLINAGVNLEEVKIAAGAQTGMVRTIGMSMKCDGGANLLLDGNTVNQSLSRLVKGSQPLKAVITNQAIRSEASQAAIEFGHTNNILTICNSSPQVGDEIRRIDEQTYSKVDILVVNEIEAKWLLSHAVDEELGSEELGHRLFNQLHPKGAVVVTYGSDGAVMTMMDRGVLRHKLIDPQPIQADEVIDAVGAGDALIAAMASHLHTRRMNPRRFTWLELSNALEFATEVAAVVVKHEWAQAAIDDHDPRITQAKNKLVERTPSLGLVLPAATPLGIFTE